MSKYTYMEYLENNATYTELELDSCKELFLSRCSVVTRCFID